MSRHYDGKFSAAANPKPEDERPLNEIAELVSRRGMTFDQAAFVHLLD